MNECWLHINKEDFCDCPEHHAEDFIVSVLHLAHNIVLQGWALKYDTLDAPGADSCLCRYGRCRICGKRLCACTDIPGDKTGDSFLAAVYRWMYQIWYGHPLPEPFKTFREMFSALFHEADKPFVDEWLKRPENASVSQMYRK